MSAATAAPTIRRILAINMSHIGGVLLMTPALELLHQLYPEAEISALVRSGTGPVLQHHPLIARIYMDGKITGNQQMHQRTKASLWSRLVQIPHGLRLIAALRRNGLIWRCILPTATAARFTPFCAVRRSGSAFARGEAFGARITFTPIFARVRKRGYTR